MRIRNLVCFVFLFFYLLPVLPASADEGVSITADHLEYSPETSIYMGKGSVKIIFDNSYLIADSVQLNNKTLDAIAVGNITYENTDSIIRADRIDLNLKTKLGTIYEGYIFQKNKNSHIRSDKIEKTGDKSFFLKRASITTCDADSPSWKISGSDIYVEENVKLTAWHSTFYVKKLPLLYVPYFWMPLTKQRETGFLFPSFGYSSKRGQYYKQGFFWAVKDNQDITFYLDHYSKKGLAQGLDYRYVITPDINGEFWAYHVRDNQSSRDLFEFKTYHNMALPYNISSYLKLHYVNYFDYYDLMESTSNNRIGFESMNSNPFGYVTDETQLKYLESNLHISKPFKGGRAYLLSQYRQNLEGSSNDIPQTLPEIALILNTKSKDLFSFNLAVKGTNFVRDEGQKGQRIDINPIMHFSYGRSINLTQRVGLRETIYFLKNPDASEDRLSFDASTTLISRIFKKYSSFIHIIEPSLEYTYTPEIEDKGIPVFDSIDSFEQESKITYSLTNELRGIGSSNLNAKFRLSQDYDLIADEDPFSVVLAEGSLRNKMIQFNVNASYDVYTSQVTDTISSLTLKGEKAYIGLGKNFRRSSQLDQMTYNAGLKRPILIGNTSIPLNIQGQLWYNLNTSKTERMNIRSSYKHQCWKLSVNYTKLPDDYMIMFVIELEGLGAISSETFREDNFIYQQAG